MVLYSLNVRNPFDLNTMIYSSRGKCMSELVRQFGDLGATGQPVMNEDGSVSRLQ